MAARARALVVVCAFAAASGPAWAEKWKAIPELQGHACAPAVEKLLFEWGSAFDWESGPVAPPEPRVYRSPTSTIGVWTELWLHSDGSVETRRTTAATTVAAMWRAPECRPGIGVKERTFGPPPANGSFTDEDLRALVGKHPAGVVYAWSPGMPLSISGIREMRAAAKELGVPVFGVLDPEADAAIAETEAKRAGLPSTDLRRIDSLELLNRGVHVHYPGIVLFAGGKIVGPRLPGHATAAEYREFLERHLPRKDPKPPK